jgi:hypothetical protein
MNSRPCSDRYRLKFPNTYVYQYTRLGRSNATATKCDIERVGRTNRSPERHTAISSSFHIKMEAIGTECLLSAFAVGATVSSPDTPNVNANSVYNLLDYKTPYEVNLSFPIGNPFRRTVLAFLRKITNKTDPNAPICRTAISTLCLATKLYVLLCLSLVL